MESYMEVYEICIFEKDRQATWLYYMHDTMIARFADNFLGSDPV